MYPLFNIRESAKIVPMIGRILLLFKKINITGIPFQGPLLRTDTN